MPIYDAGSDNSSGGTNTYGNSSGHVLDLSLPSEGHGIAIVTVFGWCPQESGAARILRRYEMAFTTTGGVTTVTSPTTVMDQTDPALANAVIAINAPSSMAVLSVDVTGVSGLNIGWEADIKVQGQIPPSF